MFVSIHHLQKYPVLRQSDKTPDSTGDDLRRFYILGPEKGLEPFLCKPVGGLSPILEDMTAIFHKLCCFEAIVDSHPMPIWKIYTSPLSDGVRASNFFSHSTIGTFCWGYSTRQRWHITSSLRFLTLTTLSTAPNTVKKFVQCTRKYTVNSRHSMSRWGMFH